MTVQALIRAIERATATARVAGATDPSEATWQQAKDDARKAEDDAIALARQVADPPEVRVTLGLEPGEVFVLDPSHQKCDQAIEKLASLGYVWMAEHGWFSPTAKPTTAGDLAAGLLQEAGFLFLGGQWLFRDSRWPVTPYTLVRAHSAAFLLTSANFMSDPSGTWVTDEGNPLDPKKLQAAWGKRKA